MAWKLANSLDVLRSQINAAFPKRSKASDGTKGDDAHAKRKSDHNVNARGVVNALDITHDPKNGVDIQKLADALLASKDVRISYIICNGRIASGTGGSNPAFKWRAYTGANKHNKHVHISVKDKIGDNATPWSIAAFLGKATPVKATPAPPVKATPAPPVKATPAPPAPPAPPVKATPVEMPAAADKHTEVITVPGPEKGETSVITVQNPQNQPASPQVPTRKTGLAVLAALIVSLLTAAAKYFGG